MTVATAWLQPVVDRLNYLLQLQDGWDGPETLGIGIEVAQKTIETLGLIATEKTRPPSIAPGQDGSVQLAWYARKFELEIDVPRSGDLVVSLYEHASDQESELTLTSSQLSDAIEQLAADQDYMVWEPNPTRDATGNVLPHDDPVSVPSEWTLLRHVHPAQWSPDDRTGSFRPQSIAFTFSTAGSGSMSVDIEPPMRDEGLLPTHYAFLAGKGVVRISDAKARELHLRAGPEPIPDNPHHGGIWAPNPAIPKGQLDKCRRELSRSFELVALPPGGIIKQRARLVHASQTAPFSVPGPLLEMSPDLTIESFSAYAAPHYSAELRARYVEGFRRAGLPEKQALKVNGITVTTLLGRGNQWRAASKSI